ncbi:MAG: hypothetical protein Q9162_006591 [Coniocarpon cinnabarinum]
MSENETHGSEHVFKAFKSLQDIDIDSFPDSVARGKALAEARALVSRLETPFERMFHVSHEIPAFYAALCVANDQGVFETLDSEHGSPKTAQQLARSGDPALLNCFLRMLAAKHIIAQVGPANYEPTRFSSALRSPAIASAIGIYADMNSNAFISLPKFLEHTKYENPTDIQQSNWQYMLGRDETYFEWLTSNPEIEANFGNFMSGYASQRDSWLDVYPGHEIMDNSDHEGPLIVDIGGGLGQDLAKFLHKFPHSAGRLYLQDLPGVIHNAQNTVPHGIKAEIHDFFKPQLIDGGRGKPICNAGASMPDDKSHAILQALKPAMRKNYSRLLLHELAIPSENASLYQVTADLTMAALFSSRERSEEDWMVLLKGAGFRIVKIWRGSASEAVIEAEVE